MFVPTCWGVKTPVIAVGEAGDIELNIRSCQTGPLPAWIFAALASESADVSVAGPIDGTKQEAEQSWTWRVTASKAGRHDLEFAVYPAGLQSYTIKTPIIVNEAKEPDDDGLMKALSTSNSALNSLAGGLASLVTIVTTLGTIVALRRTRSKKDGAVPAAPQSGAQRRHPTVYRRATTPPSHRLAPPPDVPSRERTPYGDIPGPVRSELGDLVEQQRELPR